MASAPVKIKSTFFKYNIIEIPETNLQSISFFINSSQILFESLFSSEDKYTVKILPCFRAYINEKMTSLEYPYTNIFESLLIDLLKFLAISFF